MSPIGTPVPGAFPLQDVGALPNVTIAYPGERWSEAKASAAMDPGTAVIVAASGTTKVVRQAVGGDLASRVAVASRTVDVPDVNTGSLYNPHLGPNEIKNLPIRKGDYVLRLYSGVLLLTLVVPDDYVAGDLIGWDADGVRPAGKAATNAGAWAKDSAADIDSVFEVMEWRPVNVAKEGILTVRSLKGQGPF